MYPSDQGNLLTCVNASQVADHALKSNYEATVFTKLDQADFMNRVTRRFKAYADLVAASELPKEPAGLAKRISTMARRK